MYSNRLSSPWAVPAVLLGWMCQWDIIWVGSLPRNISVIILWMWKPARMCLFLSSCLLQMNLQMFFWTRFINWTRTRNWTSSSGLLWSLMDSLSHSLMKSLLHMFRLFSFIEKQIFITILMKDEAIIGPQRLTCCLQQTGLSGSAGQCVQVTEETTHPWRGDVDLTELR